MQVHHGGLVAESSEGELGIKVKVEKGFHLVHRESLLFSILTLNEGPGAVAKEDDKSDISLHLSS